MRIFIAILPDEPTRAALVESQQAVEAVLARGRRTDASNLHLTLAFLGELDEGQAQQASRALDRACEGNAPFVLALGAAGAFERRHDLVVWRGVRHDEGHEALMGLHAELARELKSEGLGVPARLSPHFTLFRSARMGKTAEGTPPAKARPEEALSELSLPDARLSVREAHLMLSHHPEGGRLTYTSLHAAPLGGEGMAGAAVP
jgi:2'-5' RNA ligase